MLLQVKDISSGYGPVRVLWDVSLHMMDGEIVGVIGANGSGKTTLLRTISGMIRNSGGSISFEGTPITSWPPHKIARSGIVHVPEGRRLFGPLTVYENLLCGLYANRARSDKNSHKELLEFVFNLFPILRERRTQHAETMSGGQQQMLAIARGLMASPKLLLIDEPSLGLAPLVVESLAKTLKTINEKGISILLVEQNSRLALSLSGRVYVFDQGRVAMEGQSQELAADPRIKQIYLC